MGWKPRGWILIGVLLSCMTAAARAQVTTTQVADTIFHADGTPATGTILISWPSFTTSTGAAIPSGSLSAPIATGGAFTVSLTPNSGATPIGTYYTAVLHLDDGTVTREYWVVPVSQTPVKISAIESTVLPTSVAMQTVSKAYVDTAIAAAIAGTPMVTTTPYVLKTGDTMSGPLNLPGDPVSPAQAADKNYVDTSVAGLQSGLAQKVSTIPTTTQIVSQPTGTELAVNHLNQVEYASQYATATNSNGIANATASSDCASGCDVTVERSYPFTEGFNLAALPSGTHLTDRRGGTQTDAFINPLGPHNAGLATGEQIQIQSTISTDLLTQQSASSTPASIGLVINSSAIAGGSNLFPEFETVPYFKMGYSALSLIGTYNTQGQHGLMPQTMSCFGVGDCLLGSRFVYADGGWRDDADEGAHLYDTLVTEDPRVFQGTCVGGCTPGSISVTIRQDANGGTQGDGRFLIDKNPATEITSASTGGQIINGNPGSAHATVQFSGTNFPVSVFLSTGQVIASQPNAMEPGTVTFPIATSGMPSGFASSTTAIGNQSGVACVVDQNNAGGSNYEMAPYTVVDGTHLTMTFNKPHHALATLAFGGLCGYGIEETVDTTNGIRQVFPVVGSYSPTALYYEALGTPVLGAVNQTGAFMNTSAPIGTMTRTNGVVNVVCQLGLNYDLNGSAVTIAGAADPSFNGTFTITTTGANLFTFQQAGPDSSTTGGTVSMITGNFVLYPMAEVLSVMDPANKYVDGQMTLAPNTVAWAANDPVEQPHFFQEYISADISRYTQYVPRPTIFARAGLEYGGNNGGSFTGWSINNASPTGIYIGYGGTHTKPLAAYESLGVWTRNMDLNAGEQAVFNIQCNLHGCANWNSNYDLFELQSSAGEDYFTYAPQTSNLTMIMRGANFNFSPTGLTLGTLNATTINATTIHGAVSATSVPVFGASGSAHAPGAVPDPGATAGSTRYLREDGTWAVPAGGGSGTLSVTNLFTGPTVTSHDSAATATFASSGAHDAELQGTNTGNARAAFTLSSNFGGSYAPLWEFGTDVAMNGTKDYYIYNYATGHPAIDIAPSDDVSVYGNLKPGGVYQGPPTAPTGGCSTVGWVFSQDGHISFCNGSTWTQKM